MVGEGRQIFATLLLLTFVAGMRIEKIAGTKIGCFMGSFAADYASLLAHDDMDVP